MEFIGTRAQVERTEEERRKTAEDIHAAITHSLSQLIERDGLSEGHSSVTELLEHQAIASRALRQFDSEDSLTRAA